VDFAMSRGVLQYAPTSQKYTVKGHKLAGLNGTQIRRIERIKPLIIGVTQLSQKTFQEAGYKTDKQVYSASWKVNCVTPKSFKKPVRSDPSVSHKKLKL
jgi:hypothetical protein